MLSDDLYDDDFQAQQVEDSPEILSAKEAIETQSADIAKQIVAENDLEKSKQLVDLFNMHQNKRNVLRVMKLNKITDKVLDVVDTRVSFYGNVIQDKDLVAYLRVLQDSNKLAAEQVNDLKEITPVQFNQTNNQVNINLISDLDRDQRENVYNAVQKILKNAAATQPSTDESFTVDFKQEDIN